MEFDDLFTSNKSIGSGRLKLILFLLCMAGFPAAFQNLGYIFWANPNDHWCHVPKSPTLSNISEAAWKDYTIPRIDGSTGFGESVKYEQCLRYDVATQNVTANDVNDVIQNGGESRNTSSVSCFSWDYDDSLLFSTTIVTKYDLVCQRGWLRPLTQSVYMIGKMIGTVTFGALADRFGRRSVLLPTVWVQAVAGCVLPFCPNIGLFMAVRFLIALAITGTFEIAYVIAMELTAPRYRELVGNLFMITWALGYMMLAGLAYLCRHFVYLQLLTCVPLLVLAFTYWLVPESPRWLLANGKPEEALKILRNVVKVNVPAMATIKVAEQAKEKDSLEQRRALRHPFFWIMTLVLWLLWFSNSNIYFGLSYNTSDLVGNFFLNNFLLGAVEVPAYVVAWLVYRRCGRRYPLCALMVLAGTALFFKAFLPQDWVVPIVVTAMVGKFAITATFSMIYIVTNEFYATSVRTLGFGMCNAMSRVGGTLAPQAVVLEGVMAGSSTVLFATLSVFAGLSVLILPETKGAMLPQTCGDSIQLARSTWLYRCLDSTGEKQPVKPEADELVEHVKL